MSSDHLAACRALATRLPTLPAPGPVLIGLDGFIDHIIAVVDTRSSPTAFTRIPGIDALARRLAAAAGQSTNLELVVERTKIGGNGPIMAAAMQAQGAATTLVGLLGEGAVDPVFAPLATAGARLVSMGPPAVTDALEFGDGKVMLGKLGPLARITTAGLRDAFGGDAGLRTALRTPRLIATVNWTMALGMTGIWRDLAATILPGLRSDRPLWFVDLADPVKRPVEDLREALDALGALQRFADVVLGVNGSEARQVAAALGLPWPEAASEREAAAAACAAIRERLGIHQAMCHLTGSAACAWAGGRTSVDGFLCPAPRITTGAGDHFNAGYAGALLSGAAPAEALLIGGATSGCYVRDGESPDRARLARFLATWTPGA